MQPERELVQPTLGDLIWFALSFVLPCSACAGTAGLEVVQLDNALFVTTKARAVALKKAHVLRRVKKGAFERLDEELRKEEEKTDRLGEKALQGKKGQR
jgi:hypothetical protein